jgi:hypothetical protein
MASACVLVVGALYWISPTSRQILRELAAFRRIGADLLARRVGLRNRYECARALARDGLPTLQDLRAWMNLMDWVLEWELGRKSLYRIVLAEGLEPAACYRTVKRLTGLTWRTVRSRGIVSVLQDLRSRCIPTRNDRQRGKKERRGSLPAALLTPSPGGSVARPIAETNVRYRDHACKG